MKTRISTIDFESHFIPTLVERIKSDYLDKGKDLTKLALIFGGKRPALFIKQALAGTIKKSFLPPKIFTIDEFIDAINLKAGAFASPSDLDSCYTLYQLTKEKVPSLLKGRESFAQFLPWTREILSFIDQLDLEMVEDKALENIKANAQIGYDVPPDINRLLKHIIILRKAYHQYLQDTKSLSRGMKYLNAARVIKDVALDEFEEIIFCNFFYFTRCEEGIVRHLYEKNKATLIFQGDERRWPVLARIARTFDCAIQEEKLPQDADFDLRLYAAFDAHSQIGIVREIIKKISNLDQTVIVLPEPDRIVPLLSEVAAISDNFNVSLGYPLKRSSLYSLCQSIFEAQKNRQDDRYYSRDYLKVVRHPFVKNMALAGSPALTRVLVHKIEEALTGKNKTAISGSLFIGLEEIQDDSDVFELTLDTLKAADGKARQGDLKKVLKVLHELLFTNWETVDTFSGFCEALQQLLNELMAKSFVKNHPINVNIASRMFDLIAEFELASFSKETFPKEEIFKIFDNKISSQMVAFSGSPLKGLQILGLFETRSLNFTNVIILDVNEGSLPNLNVYEPLIPREVMVSLNLDRLELEEEIQRYQFMRLISSAKNVHLVYQESKDKEKSRFIEELVWQKEKAAKALGALRALHCAYRVKVAPRKVAIKKTPAMVKALREHRFSASSVNMYLRDPVEFYYSYVLGLREQEDLLDEPEGRQVGTFVHALLEDAFKPFLGKKPKFTASFHSRFAREFEERFTQTFGRSMRSDSVLLKSILWERLTRFIDNEQSSAERQIEKILYLENRFEETIPLSCGDVRFSYVVDRIDQYQDGTVVIIDYKTGTIDQMPKNLAVISQMPLSRESIRDNIRSFQIPLYFHYLNRQFKDRPINAALYNLRTLNIQEFIDEKRIAGRQEINQTFLRALDFIITEILDEKTDFVSETTSKQ